VLVTAGAAGAQVCGNLNGGGNVDTSDLLILLPDLGCTGGDCVGDVDGDGDTDQSDLAWLLIYFGCPGDIDCGPCEPQGDGDLLLEFVAVDNSDISFGEAPGAPNFDGGVTHFTFDLRLTTTGDNDWTTAASTLELAAGVELFRHTVGDGSEPSSDLLGVFPALAYDTFFADPPDPFDDGPFGLLPQWTPTGVSALWFDVARLVAADATLQRFTLIVDAGAGVTPGVLPDGCMQEYAVLADLTVEASGSATGGDLATHHFTVVDLSDPICLGDIDDSGDVGQGDLGELLGVYGLDADHPDFDPRADLDCDGDVDQADLGALLGAYGTNC
jgi:hypothetical protein